MTSSEHKQVGDIPIEVVYKKVKHLHLSVHPPEGNVRAVVPLGTGSEKVHLFVTSRLSWIRRKRREMAKLTRLPPIQYTDGDSVYLWGKQYRLRLRPTAGRHEIRLSGEWLDLFVQKGTALAGRKRAVNKFYRQELENAIPYFLQKWEKSTLLKANDYRIKMMYTKWGSCNVAAKRIWLNLELAKHPKACLSYIILHELLHLEERGHTAKFQSLMTKHLPGWRSVRETLNNGLPGLPEL